MNLLYLRHLLSHLSYLLLLIIPRLRYVSGMMVQDNLRTRFVNGQKLFIPSGGGQPQIFTAQQQNHKQFSAFSQQQLAQPQQRQQQQSLRQPQMDDNVQAQNRQELVVPIRYAVNGNVVDFGEKRKWQKNKTLPNVTQKNFRPKISKNRKKNFSEFQNTKNKKTSKGISKLAFLAPQNANTDMGYYYAADNNAQKGENSTEIVETIKKQGKGKKFKSKSGEIHPKTIVKKIDEKDKTNEREKFISAERPRISENANSYRISTQSTEDFAEPPPPPPDTIIISSTVTSQPTSTLKPNLNEKKEGKKKKKKKGKGKDDPYQSTSTTKKGPSRTVGINTSKSSPPNGEDQFTIGKKFTEHVNPDRVTSSATEETTTNGYTPPITAAEHAIATMLRCQDMTTRALIPSATACRNTRSDKVCAYLFTEVDRRTGRRDVKCNLQGMEDIAESCRKTCGICCEDINYSCEDDNNGIIDCSKQLDKCHIPKWFGVLSRFCAGSCGLCALTKCRDYDNTCRVRKSLCLEELTIDYMRENCARTCGFCFVTDLVDREEEEIANIASMLSTLAAGGGALSRHIKPHPGSNGSRRAQRLIERPPKMGGGTIAVPTAVTTPECVDREANCPGSEELCGNSMYAEYMIKFCTKTCLKCGTGLSSNAIGSSSIGKSATAAAEMLRHFKSPLLMMEPSGDSEILEESEQPPTPFQPYSEPKRALNLEPMHYARSVNAITMPSFDDLKQNDESYGILDLFNMNVNKSDSKLAQNAHIRDVIAKLQRSKTRSQLLNSQPEDSDSEWSFGNLNPFESKSSFGIAKLRNEFDKIDKLDGKKCHDRHHECEMWKTNGLCTNRRFSVEDRLRLCPKSCELCSLLI